MNFNEVDAINDLLKESWSYADDGYGEECDPPEPGKRWITIFDNEGDEVAVLVNRKGEPTEQQLNHAALIAAAPKLLNCVMAMIQKDSDPVKIRESCEKVVFEIAWYSSAKEK